MAVETENFIASSTDSSHFWCYSNILCCICRRNQNYASILRFLNLGDKKLNPFDITHRFTHLFWLGDLNYRVEMASSVSHKPCFISTLHTDSWTLLCCGFSLRSMVVLCFCFFKKTLLVVRCLSSQLLTLPVTTFPCSLHRKLKTLCQRSNSSSTRNCSPKTSSAWRGKRARSSCILVSFDEYWSVHVGIRQKEVSSLLLPCLGFSAKQCPFPYNCVCIQTGFILFWL